MPHIISINISKTKPSNSVACDRTSLLQPLHGYSITSVTGMTLMVLTNA